MADKKQSLPAFLLNSRDWLADTAALAPAEKGILIDLMCYQHIHLSLPADTTRLARIVAISHEEFLTYWEGIKHLFRIDGDHLVNQLVDQILTIQSERTQKNTISGIFATLIRMGNFSPEECMLLKDNFKIDEFLQYEKKELRERITKWSTNWLANGNQVGNQSIYINNDIIYTENINRKEIGLSGEGKRKKKEAINIDFESFWSLYDKKVGKEKTRLKWLRLTDDERTECMKMLPAYIAATPAKVYRKDPATYLQNKSWEDEIITHNGKSYSAVPVEPIKSRSEICADLAKVFDDEDN